MYRSAISTSPIKRHEVVHAISALMLNKLPGLDYAMTAEALKNGGEFIVDKLHEICSAVFNEKFAPKQ